MKTTLFIFVLFALGFYSCRPKDEILTGDQIINLRFSEDSILFDTVFTDQLSVTRRLRLYNSLENAVNIDQISLGGFGNSHYSLIINGQKTNDINNLFLKGKDSIYILVTVTLTKNDQSLPFLVSDSIIVRTKRNLQKVYLTSWGQNADYYKGDTLRGDVIWDSTQARFIYKSILVAEGASLTIQKGTNIYATKNSAIIVAGKLIVQGDSGKKVTFSGPRLDKYFDEIPGQWAGIVLLPSSQKNSIDWAEIKNAQTAVKIGVAENTAIMPELKITNTIIKNITKSGIEAYNSKIIAWNCVIANCADYGFYSQSGGDYSFYNNTIALYEHVFRRNGEAMNISDKNEKGESSNPVKLELINTIIWGNKPNEVVFNNRTSSNWTMFNLKRNIIKTDDKSLTSDTATFWNVDPLFKDYRNSNFEPDSLNADKEPGPVVGKGLKLNLFSNDLKGKARGDVFDIGAYQH